MPNAVPWSIENRLPPHNFHQPCRSKCDHHRSDFYLCDVVSQISRKDQGMQRAVLRARVIQSTFSPQPLPRFILLACTSMLASSAPLITKEVIARIQSSFKLGLIGDALALGGHYEYDARKILASGGYRDFSAPGEANNGIGWGTANYHPGKVAGDMTDSGWTLVRDPKPPGLTLLSHVRRCGPHAPGTPRRAQGNIQGLYV